MAAYRKPVAFKQSPEKPSRPRLWKDGAILAALLASISSLGVAALGYFGAQSDKTCDRAFQIVSDEKLNPGLSPTKEKQFLAEQLRIARSCNKL